MALFLETTVPVAEKLFIVRAAIPSSQMFVLAPFHRASSIFEIVVMRMLLVTQQLQIFGAIICPVLIYVVNNLIGSDKSPNQLLHYNNMLKCIAVRSSSVMRRKINHNVAFIIHKLTTFPPRMSFQPQAKLNGCYSVFLSNLWSSNILTLHSMSMAYFPPTSKGELR